MATKPTYGGKRRTGKKTSKKGGKHTYSHKHSHKTRKHHKKGGNANPLSTASK